MTIDQAYEKVNAQKPSQPVSILTFEEAQKAIRKMYRHLKGDSFPFIICETSGNRYTWLNKSKGAFMVNVGKGWDDLIHMFSHWYHRRYIGGRPHSKSHARIERKLRKWAIDRGWLTGSLKTETVEQEYSREAAREDLILRRQAQVARLERKIKALTTRLKTANRSLGALQRAQAKTSS